jgi:hypothetical protein
LLYFVQLSIWVFNRFMVRDSIPFVVVCRFRAPLHMGPPILTAGHNLSSKSCCIESCS